MMMNIGNNYVLLQCKIRCAPMLRTLVRLRRLKWLWIMLLLIPVAVYLFIETSDSIDTEFSVAKELTPYDIGPRLQDDTLRIAIIGDSWAEWHVTLGCDSIIYKYAKRMTPRPVKCYTRGKGGAMTKQVYYFMFRSMTQEVPWENDLCTQPLIEKHPDYCVIMVGINDCWKKRPLSYYTGNYHLIIRLLLANHIRPVVMEIPDFDMNGWMKIKGKKIRWTYRFYSLFTGTWDDDIRPFRKALRDMLRQENLQDSVLFIPVDHWNLTEQGYPETIYQEDHVHLNLGGYHVLDSCIVSEIVADLANRTAPQAMP